MAVFVIMILLTLKSRTNEGVRLPNYIPTLQVNPGGRIRNDIVESYFRLGYAAILLYLMLFHGIRQLKRAPPAPLLDLPL